MSVFCPKLEGVERHSMSHQATKWAIEKVPDIAPMAKLVLAALAHHANKHGRSCHPGLKTLAIETGLSERRVRSNLRTLMSAGLIFPDDLAGGRGHKTDYYLPVKGDGNDTEIEAKEDVGDIQRRTERTPKEDGADTAILIEQSVTVKEQAAAVPARVRTWEAPEWFLPMTLLEGYKRRNHSKSCESIEAYCKVAEVGCAAIVSRFCQEWPWLKVEFGWSDPVRSLNKTKAVQVSKMRNDERRNGTQPRASPSRGAHKPIVARDPDPAWRRS